MSKTLKVLLLGDVVGQPGCRALFMGLPSIVKKTHCDLVIANGENAADGFGMTPELVASFFKSGVDVITSGNHIWQRREILPLLESEDRLLRPENYPLGVAGKGLCLVGRREIQVAVLNLEGRVQLADLRCPFTVGKETVRRLKGKAQCIVVDFHAEVPEEKEALAMYLDGQISALVGTHTHVQTADERILKGGTGYITDVGMTGPMDSVIGMNQESSINRGLMQIPFKMEVKEAPPVMMGVLLEIDPGTGKTVAIERLRHEFLALQA